MQTHIEKIIPNKLIVLLTLILSLPNITFTQDNSTNSLHFEVNRIYPYILITKSELQQANTLMDLNSHYKSSWIKTYISVEISTIHQGKTIKAVSKNDLLSQEQKELMNRADVGTNISVLVKYIPQNTLKHNDPKEIHFSVSIDPEIEAKYLGGQAVLRQYLKTKVIDKIPANSFEGYDLAAVKFTISEEGAVINAHIFGAEYKNAPDEKIEQLLLETISNMPCWEPASYANGTKVQQEFVAIVGNTENCIVNLLNIQRNGFPKKG